MTIDYYDILAATGGTLTAISLYLIDWRLTLAFVGVAMLTAATIAALRGVQ